MASGTGVSVARGRTSSFTQNVPEESVSSGIACSSPPFPAFSQTRYESISPSALSSTNSPA